MKKPSLKSRITSYFKRNPDWIHKGTIETLAKSAGFLGDNSTRRIRELVEEGILEKDLSRDGYYRYKMTPEKKQELKPRIIIRDGKPIAVV